MRLIVAGSRDFMDVDLAVSSIRAFRERHNVTEIVSGGARGADALGEWYAKNHGLKLTVFKADWKTLREAAGPIRNTQMGDYADALLAFWDGVSSGTKHMIDYATKKGLVVEVVRFEK